MDISQRLHRKLSTVLQPILAGSYLLFCLVAYGFEVLDHVLLFDIAMWFGVLLWSVESARLLLTDTAGIRAWLAAQRHLALQWLIVAVAFATIFSPALFAFGTAIFQLVTLVRAAMQTSLWSVWFPRVMTRPALVLAVSFMVIIFAGTGLLMLPRATIDNGGAGFTDALFTSTSATCVTGLAVLNTAQDEVMIEGVKTFSRFGQVIILLLIQVGGLSIMTLSAALILLAGRQLDLRSRAALGDLLDEGEAHLLEDAIAFILKSTLICELVGSVLLFARFSEVTPNLSEAIFYSVFHAISAFCNAGFALFGDNMMQWAEDPLVSLTISGLIILGGFGYSVLATGFYSVLRRQKLPLWTRWRFHVRLASIVTLLLILVGTLLTFYIEYNNTLSGLSLQGKLLASFFQSVTTRTAGFNTISIGELSRLTVLIYIISMFIGASPGGTGGGVKTTTVAVLFLGLKAALGNRKVVELWGRKIDNDVVLRSLAIVILSACAVLIVVGGLLVLEADKDFMALLFEAVSAFGTVGLSLGITPFMTDGGKLFLVAIMFLGRIGPLGLALALKRRDKPLTREYPAAKVAVG